MSWYQKGKTNLDFTEARDSEWQWHQLGHMQVCTSLQTDNHASTPLLSFFTGRMPFLPPNQQCQSTASYKTLAKLLLCLYSSQYESVTAQSVIKLASCEESPVNFSLIGRRHMNLHNILLTYLAFIRISFFISLEISLASIYA